MGDFRLLIATPERQFFDGRVKSVRLPAADGYMGILPGHEPAAIAVTAGELSFETNEGKKRVCAVSFGFGVVNGGMLRLTVQTAEWPEEIDVNRALEAKRRAQQMAIRNESMVEYETARAALARATARLYVKNRSNVNQNGESDI